MINDPSVASVLMSFTSASSRTFRSIGTATRFSIRSGVIPGKSADTTAVRMTTTGSSRFGKLGYRPMPAAKRPTMIMMVNRDRARPNRVRRSTDLLHRKQFHFLPVGQITHACRGDVVANVQALGDN